MNAKYDNAPVVWREIRRALPAESLVYLGDGANCPYGSRPREEVRRLADAAVGRLAEAGCKLVVVACNTATAAAIDSLRSGYAPLPIVGMEPAVKPACLATRSGVVGVLEAEACVRAVVEPMLERGADQIVLGCTHYPFLRPVLDRIVAGRDVRIVDPSPAVARRVAELLDRGGLRAAPDHLPRYEFITFADEAYRLRLVRKALG